MRAGTNMAASRSPNKKARIPSQRGLTMIELLVALVLSGFVALAAISSLVVARRGFSTVDAASQLRDNGRFASDLIQRVVVQAGYLDVRYAVNVRSGVAAGTDPPPYVFGFNNAVLTTSTPPVPNDALNSNRTPSTAGCSLITDTSCVNGSDILVLRYQTPAVSPDSGVGDKTTINCAGISQNVASISRDDLAVSVFHVKLSMGEPSLMCSYQASDGAWVTSAQPLIQGVESFQVLYGVDGVSPGVATPASTLPDYVADRYLRADQMVVTGNAAATENTWRRVRSVRIGMVLRGPANSSQDSGSGLLYYPLGQAMSLAADAGSILAPAADGRLRQTVTFTVYLRNDQGL